MKFNSSLKIEPRFEKKLKSWIWSTFGRIFPNIMKNVCYWDLVYLIFFFFIILLKNAYNDSKKVPYQLTTWANSLPRISYSNKVLTEIPRLKHVLKRLSFLGPLVIFMMDEINIPNSSIEPIHSLLKKWFSDLMIFPCPTKEILIRVHPNETDKYGIFVPNKLLKLHINNWGCRNNNFFCFILMSEYYNRLKMLFSKINFW